MADNKRGRGRIATKTKKIRVDAKVLKQLLREVTSFLSVSNSEPDQPSRQAHGQAGAKGLWKRKKLV